MGFACFLLQTPRWICLALVLGLCVARGAFSWPPSRGVQFLILFIVHAALGVGAICAGISGLCVTPGVPNWLSRTLAVSTVVVPSMQIAFATWYLNPGLHKGAGATALQHTTNIALATFAVTVGLFAFAGLAAWQLANTDSTKSAGATRLSARAARDRAHIQSAANQSKN